MNHLHLFIFLLLINFIHMKTIDEKVKEWNDLLFPHRMSDLNPTTYQSIEQRKLAIEKEPYDDGLDIQCVTCDGLQACNILNGYLIEEKYYPDQPELKETCNVIESFGKRIEAEIFGNGRTFRDIPQCRDIVMQYLCLFYGSDSPMYRNYCIFEEEVVDPVEDRQVFARVPPCKSFCVQVATVCANDPEFIQTCELIRCPPTEEDCEPDPFIGTPPTEQALSANLGCDVPYYRTPYNTANRFAQPLLAVILIAVGLTIILI